ncbi:glycine betaine ABC transporter substrate-binding protein [Cellulomonas sp. KH9]|uniref:glycine betaine ABC transporter substrate-binding protein n=1 Tax=Cellulomonas sp. KH9 TaxID=1855324 RepID=UPI0008E28EEA|nr:glycine betaine ABC transporter substrate-binding protein [Cellulomonas sp. KH9]SFK31059.1 osmoprotectant transport system substrate-binding protein [Cellulomonas sp. KH9]
MRTSPRSRTLGVLAALTLTLSACGAPGSGGGQAETSAAGSDLPACAPVAGESLVVLEDDKGLQNADNIIPAVNAQVAADHPEVVELLDTVSAALDTDRLIGLNKAVDVDRRTSSEVATEFVAEEGLAADDTSAGTGTTLTVGAANFSESITLAEIYAEVLRSAGFDARAQTIGARETYLPALQSGELAAVPEYAATLATFLNAQVNGADAPTVASSDVDETVTALTPLAEESGIVVGEASAAQDQNAFAVTGEFAQEHDLQTLSDLAATCGDVVLAGPPECPERPFCQVGLEETYDLSVGEFKSYDFALIGQAVRQGDAAVGLVTSSDGSLAASDD